MSCDDFNAWVKGLGPVEAAALLSRHDAEFSYQTVQYWRAAGVPAKHVLRVSSVTGIPAHIIRPDVFPDPTETAA